MVTYSYPLPKEFDPYFLRSILEREFPEKFIGWSETPTQIRIDFTEELTVEEKTILDSIIASPPMPASIYEYGCLDLEDEIEKTVGVRPVRVDFDEATGRARIYFDTTLTDTQEKALEGFMKSLRRGILKRRKP